MNDAPVTGARGRPFAGLRTALLGLAARAARFLARWLDAAADRCGVAAARSAAGPDVVFSTVDPEATQVIRFRPGRIDRSAVVTRPGRARGVARVPTEEEGPRGTRRVAPGSAELESPAAAERAAAATRPAAPEPRTYGRSHSSVPAAIEDRAGRTRTSPRDTAEAVPGLDDRPRRTRTYPPRARTSREETG